MPRNTNARSQESQASIRECVDSIYEEFQWVKDQLKSTEAKEHAALAMSKLEIIEDLATQVFSTFEVEQQSLQKQQNGTGNEKEVSYRGRQRTSRKPAYSES